LLLLLVIAAVLGHWARADAEAIARGFVERYGYPGMALGTFLADGFHFPIPPQFYLLLSIASGSPAAECLAVIGGASILAGTTGYQMMRWAAAANWIAENTRSARDLLLRTFRRYGWRSALVASLLPIPYSMLCYLAGLNRLPRSFLWLLSLCRIPKLVVFYLLLRLGWA
jgi:membrane protein YqaA with SNARE-associated domain